MQVFWLKLQQSPITYLLDSRGGCKVLDWGY